MLWCMKLLGMDGGGAWEGGSEMGLIFCRHAQGRGLRSQACRGEWLVPGLWLRVVEHQWHGN